MIALVLRAILTAAADSFEEAAARAIELAAGKS